MFTVIVPNIAARLVIGRRYLCTTRREINLVTSEPDCSLEFFTIGKPERSVSSDRNKMSFLRIITIENSNPRVI